MSITEDERTAAGVMVRLLRAKTVELDHLPPSTGELEEVDRLRADVAMLADVLAALIERIVDYQPPTPPTPPRPDEEHEAQ
jgi:hypothetical protein